MNYPPTFINDKSLFAIAGSLILIMAVGLFDLYRKHEALDRLDKRLDALNASIKPVDMTPVSIGDIVRILRDTHANKIGRIEALNGEQITVAILYNTKEAKEVAIYDGFLNISIFEISRLVDEFPETTK